MKGGARGFTLFEILVVLMIVGLLAGMALPQLRHMAASVEINSQRNDLMLAIEGLGYRAYASGKPMVLADSIGADGKPVADYPLQLRPGWRIHVDRPINYSLNGVCGGGRLSVIDPENRRENFRVKAPKCELEPSGSGE